MNLFDTVVADATEKAVRALGTELWPSLVRGTQNLEEHADRLSKNEELMLAAQSGREKELMLFSARWADGAFPTLTTTHKFGAALMATSAKLSDVFDLTLPWDAVVVHVPSGLLSFADEPIDRLRLHRIGPNVTVLEMKEGGRIYGSGGMTVSVRHDEIFAPDGDVDGIGIGDNGQRTLQMARRLISGLLLTMQHSTDFTARGPKSFGAKRERGEPDHRVVSIGRAISVDCRPAVRAYLTGDRPGAAPSVQSLVRGHYKRQPIGERSSMRKVIWVEPYWRGPEDAPILARPYKVGPTEKESDGR